MPHSAGSPMKWMRAPLLAGLLALPAALMAQHRVRNLVGTVTDGHHEPLRGAVVQVHGEDTETVVSYITGRSGQYSFKRLSADLDYTVSATWNGSRSATKKLSKFDTKPVKVINLVIKPER